jgi:tetratricopeptide (TPR) repeat protein
MRQTFSFRIVRLGLLAAVPIGMAAAAVAFSHPVKAEKAEASPPQVSSPERQKPASKRVLGESLPESPVERAKMLDNLYAHLAAADDEQAAQRTAQAIVHLWRAPGSDTIKVLMERALKAVNDKQPALARKLLDAVVELAPDYAEGWSQRAHLLYLENEVERALGDLRRALALDPNHFKALDALGHILRELGQKKGALKTYQKLLEVHPFWPGAKQAVEELQREVRGQGI